MTQSEMNPAASKFLNFANPPVHDVEPTSASVQCRKGEKEKRGCFRVIFTASWAWALFAGFATIASAQEKAEDIVGKIRATYEKLESLKGDFEQHYTWSLAGETQVLNGTLYLKKGDRYRIETPNQIIVTDGKTVWTYSPDKKQVYIDYLEKSKENPLPRELVIKYTRDFRPRLLRSEKVGATDCYVLALTPRDEDSFIHAVTAWIDKSTGLAIRIEQIDINENKTVYTLKNVLRNVPLSDSLFAFNIPADTEVVDNR